MPAKPAPTIRMRFMVVCLRVEVASALRSVYWSIDELVRYASTACAHDELRVRGQPLEKRCAGNVMLVLPNRCPAKRQRVAFEATEQEPSTREPVHIVGAEH